MGYTGGTQADPTYHRLGDHTETLQVDFDPGRISYAELLEVFWSGHRPTSRAWSRQYMAAVFCHDETQAELARASRDRLAAELGRMIVTEIRPAGRFYRAEDYHQKYYLRQSGELMREFQRLFPQPTAFTDSTLAARVNGYVGGNGGLARLHEEIEALELQPPQRDRLAVLLEQLGP